MSWLPQGTGWAGRGFCAGCAKKECRGFLWDATYRCYPPLTSCTVHRSAANRAERRTTPKVKVKIKIIICFLFSTSDPFEVKAQDVRKPYSGARRRRKYIGLIWSVRYRWVYQVPNLVNHTSQRILPLCTFVRHSCRTIPFFLSRI